MKLPAGTLLGERGRGFAQAMATLDVFRTTVGAAALGFARRALDEATRRAIERRLGEGRLADNPITQSSEERREGRSVSVRVDLGGRRSIQKKKKEEKKKRE